MSYRHKIYVAFDGDRDIHYYRLMKAWKKNDYTYFDFTDVHEFKQSRDTSKEETIKRSLRERLNKSKVFVLLVGESTRYLYKYVAWEISQALGIDLPIIVINLNGKRSVDLDRCPSSLKQSLSLHISFNVKILQKALEEWVDYHNHYRIMGKDKTFYYPIEDYNRLGI